MSKKKKHKKIDEMFLLRVVVAIVLIWLATTFMVISWTVRPKILPPANNEAAILKELEAAKKIGDPAYVLSVRAKLILEYLAKHKDGEARKQYVIYKEELKDPSISMMQKVALRDQLASIAFSLRHFDQALGFYDDNIRELSKSDTREMKTAVARELNNRGVAHFILAQLVKDNDELKRSHFKDSSEDFKKADKILTAVDKTTSIEPTDKSAQLPGLSSSEHLPSTVCANKDVLKRELTFTPKRARPALDF